VGPPARCQSRRKSGAASTARKVGVGALQLALANLRCLNCGKPQKAQVLSHLILVLAYILSKQFALVVGNFLDRVNCENLYTAKAEFY
jgi:hypothetical protein